jgi:thermitase
MIPTILEGLLPKGKITGTLTVILIVSGLLTPAFVGRTGTTAGIQPTRNSEQVKPESYVSPSLKDGTNIESGDAGFVVGLDDMGDGGASRLKQLADAYRGKILNFVSAGKETKAAVVELPSGAVSAFLEDVHGNGLSSYVEPRMTMKAQFVPDDPYWNVQWGLRKIHADWAWNTTLGSRGVLVAVVDTGIDYHHPDLAANYVALGYDWVNGAADPMDDTGHGTHCAGIIAATIGNSVGIAGLAQVHIMAEKVLDSQGEGYSDWIAEGIIHAVDQGAKIISISFGDYENSQVIYDAIKYAYDAGVLLVAAAGNYNSDLEFYPASYDEVIAVTATDANDTKASFSDFGNWVELAAPGVDVYSTYLNDDYETLSGASMACPHVSGLAALVMSAYANITADFVRLLLRYADRSIQILLSCPRFRLLFHSMGGGIRKSSTEDGT